MARVRRSSSRCSINAGTAAKLDVIRAQVDASQAQNDLIATERDLANARAGLNRLLGRALGADIVPADTLAVPASLVVESVSQSQVPAAILSSDGFSFVIRGSGFGTQPLVVLSGVTLDNPEALKTPWG